MKHFFLALTLLFACTIITCKKSKAPGCGCDAPLMDTLNGTIGHLDYDISGKEYYVSTAGPEIDGSHNVICDTNSTALRLFLDSVRVKGAIVTISGERRKYCQSDSAIYIGQWTNIKITSIAY
jgi:hypothetical protein